MVVCPLKFLPLRACIFICSVLTPYLEEEVLFSIDGLEMQNEDGVSILFYLQKIYPGRFIIALLGLCALVYCPFTDYAPAFL